MSHPELKRRWSTCPACGVSFYGTLEKCADCRAGVRTERLEFRRQRRIPGSSRRLRQWQQRNEVKP